MPESDIARALALAREADAHKKQGRALTAIGLFQQALQFEPRAPGILQNLAGCYLHIAHPDEAVDAVYRAYQCAPTLPGLASDLLLTLLYSPSLSGEAVAAAHRQWGRQFAPRRAPERVPAGRVRIGYLSANFRSNAEVCFIEPLIRHHDRSRFEVYCYSAVAQPDALTSRFQQLADHWRDVTAFSDEAAASLIRDDGIDILVDCSGHFGESRIQILAYKPAPIQVSFPTYPATTGLEAVDYRITDLISDPPELTASHYVEKLVRLPHVFACYQPWDETPEAAAPPVARNGYVTFGCFNRFAKLNRPLLELWAQILHRVPGSRLLFLSSFHKTAQVPVEHCEPVIRMFLDSGIGPERLQFTAGRDTRGYMDAYRHIDIALDPIPFNGMTTTCDALWMGVPVVALAGRTHVSRTGASLLTAVGLQEWIASSPEEYVEIAAQARDLPALRARLRDQVRRSPVGDVAAYTRDLEAAYLALL